MTALSNLLVFACLVAACFRARFVAISLLPAALLILARGAGVVDISSASHPLRYVAPAIGALGAGFAGWYHSAEIAEIKSPRIALHGIDAWLCRDLFRRGAEKRRLAAILVFGSSAVDILALHPFFWAKFAEWPLVPVQIIVCASILLVLLLPERWLK